MTQLPHGAAPAPRRPRRETAPALSHGRRTLAIVLLIVAAVLSVLTALGGTVSDDTAPDWQRGYPPCAAEDSPGPCYWDATERGNGAGRSFVVHADGTVAFH